MVNHQIAEDGTVTPSFVECSDAARCGQTHEYLKLVGWDEFLAAKRAAADLVRVGS